jgi:hypothetical protein
MLERHRDGYSSGEKPLDGGYRLAPRQLLMPDLVR